MDLPFAARSPNLSSGTNDLLASPFLFTGSSLNGIANRGEQGFLADGFTKKLNRTRLQCSTPTVRFELPGNSFRVDRRRIPLFVNPPVLVSSDGGEFCRTLRHNLRRCFCEHWRFWRVCFFGRRLSAAEQIGSHFSGSFEGLFLVS